MKKFYLGLFTVASICLFSSLSMGIQAEENNEDPIVQNDSFSDAGQQDSIVQTVSVDPQVEFDTVQNELNQKQSELSQLESDLDTQAKDVSAKQAEMNKAQKDLADAEAAITKAQNEVNAKQTELKQKENDISIRDIDKIEYDRGYFGFREWQSNYSTVYSMDSVSKKIGYINPETEDSSYNLENVLKSLDYIDECNRLRARHGLAPLKVSVYLMLNAGYSNNASINIYHQTGTYYHSGYGVTENIASCYRNPFQLWYDDEKAIADANGYTLENYQKGTGHYFNIINPKWKTTGFAMAKGYYGYCYAQEFMGEASDAYTVAEFRALFLQYYNAAVAKKDLASLKDQLQKAKASLSTANSSALSKRSDYLTASNNLSKAQNAYKSTKEKVDQIRSEVATLKQRYDELYDELHPSKTIRYILSPNSDKGYPVNGLQLVNAVTVPFGESIPTQEAPQFDGWIFSGWKEQNAATTKSVLYVACYDKITEGVSKENGQLVALKDGNIDFHFTGLMKNNADGKWYFFRNGKHERFTGLSKSSENGKFYFSRNGILDWKFTGVAKSVVNGKWYHAKNGKLDWSFTGLSKSVENGKYYFSRKGALDWDFTGIAKSVTNGKWYFARKGKLDWGFTGIAKSVANGKWYFVHNGQLNQGYSGGAKSVTNGKWYAVQRGQLFWKFNGWMQCTDGWIRYFRNGTFID